MKNIYNKLSEYYESKQQLWIVTITSNTGSIPGQVGMKMLVNLTGEIDGTVGGGLLENKVINRVLKEKPNKSTLWTYELNDDFTKETGMICGGSLSFLIEPLIEGEQMYIYGAGHCAMALSELAAKCGFLVTVIDDRTDWANKEKHPQAFNTICCDFSQILNFVDIYSKNYHIIMTHGHKNDEKILKLLIDKNLFYLGMIGSKQKVKISFDSLRNQGTSEDLINKVKAPIGISIGSHHPFEIAVSIMAEIIQIKNN